MNKPATKALSETRIDAMLEAAVATRWREALANDPSPTATLRAGGGERPDVVREPRVVPATGPEGAPEEYEIVRRLGEGGMGVVFEAWQKSIGRAVALKMMRPTLQNDPAARALFFSETTIMGVLEHPGIVTIYDAGVTDRGRPFYAMRLVQGETWDNTMARHRLTDNLATLEHVAEIVAFAHEHGILHRDLKPANIFVSAKGDVHVADWGLAARVTPGSGVAAGAVHGGTPAYMPPEAVMGDGARISTASDVYGLGGILYEILYGTPPHDAATAAAAMRLASPPPPMATPTTPLGRRMTPIVTKALAERPEDRFPDAGAMARTLVDARNADRKRRARRRFGIVAALFILGWLLALAFAWPLWRTRQREKREAERVARVDALMEEDWAAGGFNQQVLGWLRTADRMRAERDPLRRLPSPQRETLEAEYRDVEMRLRVYCEPAERAAVYLWGMSMGAVALVMDENAPAEVRALGEALRPVVRNMATC